jgi:Ca2+-binding RTX toxin-like protein
MIDVRLRLLVVTALSATLGLAGVAAATHVSAGGGCTNCADHNHWPKIDGVFKKAGSGGVTYVGTARSDELLGHHGSDTLSGGEGSDVLWGDFDPSGQPATQKDVIDGGAGTDFIYGSHGRNTITAGPGNDVISVHYGRGSVDCGPGRDIYHVARSRKKGYKIRNCEKVDYRPESKRGALKPLR